MAPRSWKLPFTVLAECLLIYESLCNPVSSSNNARRALVKRWPLGPTSIDNWAALGDGYSAGPGAGYPIDRNRTCQRSSQSYPEWMLNDPALPPIVGRGNRNQHLSFESCTGADSVDVLDNQLSVLNTDTTFATLSVGFDDLEFDQVLAVCLLGMPGSCTDTITNARNTLYSANFFNNYHGLGLRVLADMGVQTGVPTANTKLWQTAYPSLFNENTTECDTVSFALAGNNGTLLTFAARASINQLLQELNAYMSYVIDNYSNDLNQSMLPLLSRAAFIDQGYLYSDHRFCEAGVQEPTANNPNTWFFEVQPSKYAVTPANCTGENPANCLQRAGRDRGRLFDCYIARQYQQNPHTRWNFYPDSGSLQRAFYPTPAGHKATGDYIVQTMDDRNQAYVSGENLRIMPMGDSITAGYRSTDGNGYRKRLYDVLAAEGNNVTLVGDAIGGTPPYDHSEGHSGYTIDTLLAILQQEGSIQATLPNIVTLMIGTNDVNNHQYPLDQAYAKLTSLVDYVYANSPNVTIIMAQITPIGLPADFPGVFPPTQQQVIEFNGMVSRVANAFQEMGYKMYLIHTTLTLFDHYPADSLHPSDLGYLKLAYDFIRGIHEIYELGWITPPLPPPPPPSNICNTTPTLGSPRANCNWRN